MTKEYVIKFVNSEMIIKEKSKEDYKELMNLTEKQFMERVLIRITHR